jgi:ribose transport system permease protein
MTLATLTALRGVGLLIMNGATISITNETFTGFSRGDFLGVPNLFWMVVVVAIPGYIFLHQSRFWALSLCKSSLVTSAAPCSLRSC